MVFDDEELGMLGSKALPRDLRQSGWKLRLMVSLMMLGYTSPTQYYPLPAMRRSYGEVGDFIPVVGNAGTDLALSLMRQLISQAPAPGQGKHLG